MHSANSDRMKSVRKIHSAQKPRRLALKFCQRRRLIGDGASRRTIGGTTMPEGGGVTGADASMVVRSSTSDLPGLEVDARIDPGIGEVGDQVHHQPEQREYIECREYH